MAIDVAAIRAKLAAKVAVTIENEKQKAAEESVAASITAVNVSVSKAAPTVATSPTIANLKPVDFHAMAADYTPQQFQVVEKIEELRNQLLTAHPLMPTLLKTIHTALMKDPEIVHLLQPEQIGVVVEACKVQSKVVITTTAAKKATGTTSKKLAGLTLDDL